MRRLWLLAAVLPGLVGWACDEASPLAPPGATLLLTANPSQVGLTGTSTVTALGRRADGSALNPGTEVRFSTNRGTITPLATIDSSGAAVATFRGDGRSGTATITATTGGGGTSATVDVQVGQGAETKPTVLVSVNPSNIPVGGQAEVTIIARAADNTPLGAGETVVLTTTLGTLQPDRPTTNANGTATSRLLAGNQAGTARVSALVGTSDVATTDVVIRDSATDIGLQANPSTVPPSGGSITMTAFVSNSQGQPLQGAPVTFQSERGTLSKTLEFTGTTGVATVTLTLTQDQLVGVDFFAVTASTPNATGQLLTDSTEITVQ
jgi:hypothetical protein